MRFSSFFGLSQNNSQLRNGPDHQPAQLPNTPECSGSSTANSGPSGTIPDQSGPFRTKIEIPERAWFLPTQAAWVSDPWHLRIWEKSRQVGATKTDAFDSVMKASPADARFDVWVSSRDEMAAKLYLEDCVEWAKILHVAST